jgi:hypothetical protein
MDEKSVDTHKVFKVLTREDGRPISANYQKLPHMTALVTILDGGNLFRLLNIIPNKQQLNGLFSFTSLADFAATETGWSNERIFFILGNTTCLPATNIQADTSSRVAPRQILANY